MDEDSEQTPNKMTPFELIASIRGGVPEKCDFCGQTFTDENYPTPEEAGDWACFECAERWHREDVAAKATRSNR